MKCRTCAAPLLRRFCADCGVEGSIPGCCHYTPQATLGQSAFVDGNTCAGCECRRDAAGRDYNAPNVLYFSGVSQAVAG